MTKTFQSKILIILAGILMICGMGIMLTANTKTAYAETYYTVDFTYNNATVKVDGNTKNYDMNSVFTSLGIKEEIIDIKVFDANEKQFDNNVIKNAKGDTLFDIAKTGTEWKLNINNSFLDEFTLKAYSNSNVYGILVTDPVGGSYTISYNTLGGSTVAETTGYKIVFPSTDPTKENYIFDGWYKNYDDNTGVYSNKATAGETITANITLYAKWRIDASTLIAGIQSLITGHGTLYQSMKGDLEYFGVDISAYTTWVSNANTYITNLSNENYDLTEDYYVEAQEFYNDDTIYNILNDDFSTEISAQKVNLEICCESLSDKYSNCVYCFENEILSSIDLLNTTFLPTTLQSITSFKNTYSQYNDLSESEFISLMGTGSFAGDSNKASQLIDSMEGRYNDISQNVGVVDVSTDAYSKATVNGVLELENSQNKTFNADCEFQITIVATFNTGYKLNQFIASETNSASTENTYSAKVYSMGLTVIVQSKVKGYTITYNTVGGSTVADTTSYIIVFPSTDPTKENYIFDGWYKNYNDNTGVYSNKATAGETITANTTLYAKWITPHKCNDYTYEVELTNDLIKTYYTTGLLGIEEADFYELPGGIYYLGEDISLNNVLVFSDDAVVCLNGFILNFEYPVYYIKTDNRLEIYDCKHNTTTHNYLANKDYSWTKTNQEATTDINSLATSTEEENVVTIKGGAITTGYIDAKNIKLKNVNLIGLNNGIIGTYVDAINCNFYGNYLLGDNGSCINAGYINLFNSTLMFNMAESFDEVGGQGTIYCSSKILVSGCTIKFNTAESGAGIFLDNVNTIATIIDTTISHNTATTNGAGVCYDSTATCLLEGTLITMSDDSTTAIEDIKVGDKVKSLNHETGLYESNKVIYVYAYEDSEDVINLQFESEKTLSIVGEHSLFCKEDNKYVVITSSNYTSYIGKQFYDATNNAWIELIDASCESNYVTYYSIYVAKTANCIANDLLTCPDDVVYMVNMYEFTTDNYLKANATALANDIATYGLFDFSNCTFVQTEEEFNDYNGKYYNVWLGKGLLTERVAEDLYHEGHNYDQHIAGIEGPALILGKNVTIKNNYVDEKQENVYLSDGVNIYVVDGATNINVGITMENIVGDFALDVYSKNIGFVSDNNKVNIIKTATEETFTYSLSFIKEQPTKNNDYTVVVNDNLKEDVTYQWYENLGTYALSDLDADEYNLESYDYFYGDTIVAIYDEEFCYGAGYVASFYFNNDVPCFIYFDCDAENLLADNDYYSYIVSHINNHYIALSKHGEFSVFTNECSFSLENVKIQKVNKLTSETNSKLGSTTLNDSSYFCHILDNEGNIVATSVNIKPNKITFNSNGATGTAPTTIYQLEGRKITLPANTFTKIGYKFLGWNTSGTATTSLTLTDNQYTVGNGDVTLYAIWQEKTAVAIAETAQTYTYNGSSQGFTISGNVTTGFTVQYYVDGAWNTTAPINVDSYKVKITRAEDGTYKAYEKEIVGGLKITQYTVTVVKCEDDFTYNGQNQTNDLTAYYYNESNEKVDLVLVQCLANGNRIPVAFANSGEYTVLFKFDTTQEGKNYTCEIGALTQIYHMKKKEVTITWENKNYIYNDELSIPTATYKDTQNADIDLAVTMNKALNNAGSYTATASFANGETNYTLPSIVTKEYVVNKAKVTKPTADNTVFTYTGNTQTYALANNALYTVSGALSKISAGTTEITLTLNDKDNYSWEDGTTTDFVLNFVIHKATATINVDQAETVSTYGESIVLPQATSDFGEVLCDKTASDLVNAGNYTITYTVAETDNFNGDTKIVNVTIHKKEVDEPTVAGEYKFTGEAQTVVLAGVEPYMTTTDILTQTNAGVYTITYSLDDNHAWVNGSDGVVTWEIKAVEIKAKTENVEDKPQVEVQTEEGFDSSITVTVEVTIETEVESKNLTVDYYQINKDSAKLSDKEKVGVVFDVKLLQTIDGVQREIQPSDIKEGTVIKVKMLIPDSVDITLVTRILHVHSENDIEELEFDAEKVIDGYYEVEIDRLSEFAFIYQIEDTEKCLNHIYILGILLLILILLTIGILCALSKKQVISISLEIVCVILLVVSLLLMVCNICKALFIAEAIAFVVGTLLEIFFSTKKNRKK